MDFDYTTIKDANHTIKLCFVHIPKTGGSAISEALGIDGIWHNPVSYYNEKYPDYKTFTVIRGWKDRLESSQKYHEQKKHKIKHYRKSLMGQHLPTDYYLDEPCDYYLRFEHLQKDFNKMLNDLGYGAIELKKINVSKI